MVNSFSQQDVTYSNLNTSINVGAPTTPSLRLGRLCGPPRTWLAQTGPAAALQSPPLSTFNTPTALKCPLHARHWTKEPLDSEGKINY